MYPCTPAPDWRDTAKTVAFHWARRSAHLLATTTPTRLMEGPQPTGAPVSTRQVEGGGEQVYLPGVAHCGANFAVGDWLLTSTSEGIRVVGCLTAVYALDNASGETTGYFVEAQTWPATVLQRDAGFMMVAALSSFDQASSTTYTFPITTALKPLFMVDMQGTDLLSFVEIP